MPNTPAPPHIAEHDYIRPLGSGGYADVYLFEQITPRRQVAIKVLNPQTLETEDQQRFLEEANLMAMLSDHPYIVQIYSVGTTDDGRPYLAMKYYPNVNLAIRVSQTPLTLPEALSIGIKISSAVETAHQSGILHRDIKPANILTDQYGEPGLTDFGIAMQKKALTTDAEGLSIPWAAPEVFTGSTVPDERADVYSLGATIWHLLVGHSPFFIPGGDNSDAALMQRISDIQVPNTERPDVPPELERLLALSMMTDPNNRPSSAIEFAKGLQNIEQNQGFSPTPLKLRSLAEGDTLIPQHHDLGGEQQEATRLSKIQRSRLRSSTHDIASEPTQMRQGARTSVPDPLNASAQPGKTSDHSPAGTNETVRRVGSNRVPQEDDGIANSPELPQPKLTRRAILVTSIVAAFVLGILGVIVFTHHSPQPPGTATTAGTTPNLQGAANTPTIETIGTPNVRITSASPTTVTISWTYSGQQKGDRYRYRINGGTWLAAATTSVQVKVNQGQTVCAQVQVERANGSATSAISPEVCGSAT